MLAKFGEVSTRRAHHHVAHAKVNARMYCVNCPGHVKAFSLILVLYMDICPFTAMILVDICPLVKLI